MRPPEAARPRTAWRAALSVLAALLGAPPAAPAADGPAAGDFAEIKLSGFSVGFGMLRLGKDAPPESLPLRGQVFPGRTNAVTRLLVDEASGAAFGYRLEAEPLRLAWPTIRVDVRPLGASDHKELRRLTVCPACPPPRLVAWSPSRLPPTQLVRDGEAMVIDLLERPDTGEKIVDVLHFSSETVSREALDDVRGRVGQAARHVRHADQLLARGSLDAAASEYRKAVTLQPDAAIHLRLAGCYQRLERLEPAQREYERAVRLDPTDAEAWHGLAVLQHRRGSYGKAASSYRRALKLRPDWVLARRNLATAQLDRGQLAPAFEEYRQAHRADAKILGAGGPASVKAQDVALQHYLFARVYASHGELNAALDHLKKAKDAGFKDLERVRQDVEFKPLLTDPRLSGLVAPDART